MQFSIDERNHSRVAVIQADEPVIVDGQSALDLLMTVQYETGCRKMILPKSGVDEAFFQLQTGIAGEALQKYVNYRCRLAIVGDFSGYESKALRDFIGESNRGRDIFFLPAVEDALEKLHTLP